MRKLFAILAIAASLLLPVVCVAQTSVPLYGPAPATGTNTYVQAYSPTPVLSDGLKILIYFTNGSTGASTLNVAGLGAVELLNADGSAIASGDIAAGSHRWVVYRSSKWRLVSSGAGGVTDGDKGDITVSGSGAVFDIDAGVVTGTEIATSVALAGNPTTTTQSAGDNSTRIATTAYADAAAAAGFSAASFAEALAGTSNTKGMTPLRVHQVAPRVYNVEAYGAQHDYQRATDASITSGTDDLTVSAGVFTSADVGKSIRVFGAGAAGADLLTTISAFVSSTAVTLAANASTTVSAKVIEWGTDDTPFIQAAINAAFTAGGGVVYFPNGVYLLFGSLVTSVDGVNPNCQIYLPLAQFSTTAGVPTPAPTVKLLGEAPPPLWGTVLASTQWTVKGVILKSVIVGTGTLPSVIGSSFYNTGFGNANAASIEVENIAVRVKSVTGTTHVAPTMSAYNFSYPSVVAINCKADTESDPFSSALPASTVTGFYFPNIQNNGNIVAYNLSAQNFGTGFNINEHFSGDNLFAHACLRGADFGNSNHASFIGRFHANGCATGLYFSGAAKFYMSSYTAERKSTGGYWFTFANDFDGAVSNAAIGNVASTYIINPATGSNIVPQVGSNVTTVTYPNLLGSKRFWGNGGFSGGNAAQSSFAMFHEYNEGTAGVNPNFRYTTNQSTTSDGTITAFQFVNSNVGGAEKRVGQWTWATGGATNTGRLYEFVSSAGTLTEVRRAESNGVRHSVSQYIGGTTTPTARLHLAAGTTAASSGPIKLTEGSNPTAAEDGIVNYVSNNLTFTETSTVYTLAKTLTNTATLNFDLTAVNSQDLTITVTGAADGDPVALSVPAGSATANVIFTAWVSGTNTVTVRASRIDVASGADPASGSFRASVIHY